jgi:hypothetical protein
MGMSESRRQLRMSVIVAVSSVCLVNSVFAGPISPGSSSSDPPIISNPTGGMSVADANVITNQYQSVGLDGSHFLSANATALATINGATAFVPVVNGADGFHLDYSGFVGFQIVNPTSGAGTTTNHLSIEFLGSAGTGGVLQALDAGGNVIGTTAATGTGGAHGGRVATLDLDGVAMFEVRSLFDSHSQTDDPHFWGVGSIDIGSGDISNSPEPATIITACVGLFGAAGVRIRRRRCHK